MKNESSESTVFGLVRALPLAPNASGKQAVQAMIEKLKQAKTSIKGNKLLDAPHGSRKAGTLAFIKSFHKTFQENLMSFQT